MKKYLSKAVYGLVIVAVLILARGCGMFAGKVAVNEVTEVYSEHEAKTEMVKVCSDLETQFKGSNCLYHSETHTLELRFNLDQPASSYTVDPNGLQEEKVAKIKAVSKGVGADKEKIKKFGFNWLYSYYGSDGKYVYSVNISSDELI